MTGALALAALVGREGWIQHAGLTIRVRVVDVMSAYGRERYCVTPLAGTGQLWTERLTLDEGTTDAD